jgi:hypothetical protein
MKTQFISADAVINTTAAAVLVTTRNRICQS